jgi:hypothetical protein
MTTTPSADILETLAERVEAASSLEELRTALIAFEEEVESHHEEFADDVEGALSQYIDLHRLPTFGGEPPRTWKAYVRGTRTVCLSAPDHSGIWSLLTGRWGPRPPSSPMQRNGP